jgi:hypothetical protein
MGVTHSSGVGGKRCNKLVEGQVDATRGTGPLLGKGLKNKTETLELAGIIVERKNYLRGLASHHAKEGQGGAGTRIIVFKGDVAPGTKNLRVILAGVIEESQDFRNAAERSVTRANPPEVNPRDKGQPGQHLGGIIGSGVNVALLIDEEELTIPRFIEGEHAQVWFPFLQLNPEGVREDAPQGGLPYLAVAFKVGFKIVNP